MQNIILIVVLFCTSPSFAQTPFDSFDTTMKSVPLFKSDKPQKFRLEVISKTSAIKYLELDVDKRQLDYYDTSNRLIATSLIKNNEVKFLSVDPLSKKYPELTPYQFASNTPIQAIDLDGLEAFIIHGTTQEQTGVKFSQAAIDQFKRLTGNSKVDDGFRWHAPALNDMPMRKTAAEELVRYIVETRASMIANKTITEDEPVSLIGYSHGGNVNNQAADMLNKQYDIKVNIINISTPAYNSWFGADKDNALFGNAEDPQGNKGINAMIHIIHQNDAVWQLAKADMYYSDDDGKTRDYTIVKNTPELNGPINSHTNLPASPVLVEALSLLVPLRKAPAPAGLNNATHAKQNAGEQQAAQQAAANIWQSIPVH